MIPPIQDLLRPVAVDYDIRMHYIYFSDALRHKIGRRKLDGSEPAEINFITEGNVSFIPHPHSLSPSEHPSDKAQETDSVQKKFDVCIWVSHYHFGDSLWWGLQTIYRIFRCAATFDSENV